MNEDFVDLYLKWLKENMKSKILETDLGQYTEISTPFLDRHNDHILLYVKKSENGNLLLTDGGNTINDLSMCGCDIMSSPKRKSILTTILNGYGIKLEKENLCANANYTNFAQKKHSLLQAILSVNDLFVLSHSQVLNVFLEDVQMFFDVNYIPYVSNAQFNGTSGLPHTFHYAIPATRKHPERFVRAINDVSRDKIDSTLFAWGDIKELRKPGAMLYVILNDSEKQVRSDWENALINYDAKPILWTQRDRYIEELAS